MVRGQKRRERLEKRADALALEDVRKRGRPRLGWEDCVKWDLEECIPRDRDNRDKELRRVVERSGNVIR